MTTSTTPDLVPTQRRAVDVVAAVDPYDASRPDWVGVELETGPAGRFVRLVSPGGKVEFRVPVGNGGALADAIRDAASPATEAA